MPALELPVESEKLTGGEPPAIQGGAVRGRILHKLFEEVLTGETQDTLPALHARAGDLITALGFEVGNDPLSGLVPDDLAGCVARSLALPDIVKLRPNLVPEFGVWQAEHGAQGEVVRAGVADAISFDAKGQPEVVVDWKSDVAPSETTLAHYRAQVGSYLRMTGAKQGLIVLATLGKTIWID